MTVLCWKHFLIRKENRSYRAGFPKTMRTILEKVVSEGGGKRPISKDYHIGGKTATSETLPRSANKYISSFLGFVPAEDPRILGICIINNPQGRILWRNDLCPGHADGFENILPYLGDRKKKLHRKRMRVKNNGSSRTFAVC